MNLQKSKVKFTPKVKEILDGEEKNDVDPYLKFACATTQELSDNIRYWFRETELPFKGKTKPEICQHYLIRDVRRWADRVNGMVSNDEYADLSDAETTGLLAKIVYSPNSKDIKVNIQMLSSIPDSLARLREAPEKGNGYMWKQMNQDARRRRQQPGMASKLSSYMDTDDESDEETFETVWSDIVDWEGTRSYCLYLRERPHLEKPPFLVDAGLFEDDDVYVQKMRQLRSKKLWAKMEATVQK